ncbi:MAG: hypothetical protein JEZ00_17045 [Anaerolineaceae bacterium]|nr:hypothetical protein [Anaerolineaceae bacterium]
MEDPMLDNEGQLEAGESLHTESQELDTATYEPKTLVEQSGDYQRSEAIQTAVETLIENEMANTDQLEYEPGHPPEPPDLDHSTPGDELVEQEDKSILGSMPKMREDLDQLQAVGSDTDGKVEATPINLPSPRDELSATPITLPGQNDEVSATPINLPNPVEQGAPIAGSGNDLSATPINLPNPVEEVSATPITLPGQNDEVSATPITLPGQNDEVSATPITLPGQNNEVSATPITLPGQNDEVSATPITLPGQNNEVSATPITLPGQNDDVSATPITLPGQGGQVAATPINLPGTQDEISATPINTPKPVPPLDMLHDPEIETQPQGLSEPIRELDVQMPEHGLKQAEEGMDISTEMDDLMPEKGSLIGPDGKPMSDDKFGLDGIVNEDYGFGSGGPEDLRDAAASDHPDNIPGTDSPFIPGKGPNSGVLEGGGVLRDDKLEKYLEDEAADKAASDRIAIDYVNLSPIDMKGDEKAAKAGKKSDPSGAPVPQVDDPEDPPAPKKKSTQGESFEAGPSKKAGITDHSQDVMNPRYNSDLISITSPDDPSGSETAEAILPQYAEKVEEVMKKMKQVIAPEKKIGSELITDPPEHDAKNTQGKEKTSKN